MLSFSLLPGIPWDVLNNIKHLLAGPYIEGSTSLHFSMQLGLSMGTYHLSMPGTRRGCDICIRNTEFNRDIGLYKTLGPFGSHAGGVCWCLPFSTFLKRTSFRACGKEQHSSLHIRRYTKRIGFIYLPSVYSELRRGRGFEIGIY